MTYYNAFDYHTYIRDRYEIARVVRVLHSWLDPDSVLAFWLVRTAPGVEEPGVDPLVVLAARGAHTLPQEIVLWRDRFWNCTNYSGPDCGGDVVTYRLSLIGEI